MIADPNQRVGYFECLIDINAWVRSQIGRLDHETLRALVDEMDRMGKAAPPKAAEKGEAA